MGKRNQQNMTSISEVYNLGEPREKKEAAVCVECCDTDLCNSGGCGTQGKLLLSNTTTMKKQKKNKQGTILHTLKCHCRKT